MRSIQKIVGAIDWLSEQVGRIVSWVGLITIFMPSFGGGRNMIHKLL